ncbi:MAG: hypothetical protein ABIM40_05310 [Pseudomonadota bacterium]
MDTDSEYSWAVSILAGKRTSLAGTPDRQAPPAPGQLRILKEKAPIGNREFPFRPPVVLVLEMGKERVQVAQVYHDPLMAAPGDLIFPGKDIELSPFVETWNVYDVEEKDLGEFRWQAPGEQVQTVLRLMEDPRDYPQWAARPSPLKPGDPREAFRLLEREVAAAFSGKPGLLPLEKETGERTDRILPLFHGRRDAEPEGQRRIHLLAAAGKRKAGHALGVAVTQDESLDCLAWITARVGPVIPGPGSLKISGPQVEGGEINGYRALVTKPIDLLTGVLQPLFRDLEVLAPYQLHRREIEVLVKLGSGGALHEAYSLSLAVIVASVRGAVGDELLREDTVFSAEVDDEGLLAGVGELPRKAEFVLEGTARTLVLAPGDRKALAQEKGSEIFGRILGFSSLGEVLEHLEIPVPEGGEGERASSGETARAIACRSEEPKPVRMVILLTLLLLAGALAILSAWEILDRDMFSIPKAQVSQDGGKKVTPLPEPRPAPPAIIPAQPETALVRPETGPPPPKATPVPEAAKGLRRIRVQAEGSPEVEGLLKQYVLSLGGFVVVDDKQAPVLFATVRVSGDPGLVALTLENISLKNTAGDTIYHKEEDFRSVLPAPSFKRGMEEALKRLAVDLEADKGLARKLLDLPREPG